MALNDTALNAMADHLASVATHISLHTADPGVGGANEDATVVRQAAGWNAASGGDIAISSARNFTGGTASGACTHVGLWSNGTNGTGTFYGGYALSGDQAFNAAGEYTVNTLTVNGSAT